MNVKNIAIAGDHAGFLYKKEIKQLLENKGIKVQDFGTDSEESTDYPDYIHPLAKSVIAGENELGIIICGSGNGVNMTANKYDEIRSALCWETEIAELSRLHNNANVVAIPARFISLEKAEEIVNVFISTDFEGGRHQRRVEKISCK